MRKGQPSALRQAWLGVAYLSNYDLFYGFGMSRVWAQTHTDWLQVY